MSDLSIEADDLFPDDSFDDMTRKPAKKQQINLGSIFGIRPRSPSAPRKTVVRLRLLLVADDKHWPRESTTDVRKILRGRESLVTSRLHEPGYAAFWAAAAKEISDADKDESFELIVLKPCIQHLEAAVMIPSFRCRAECGPIQANHMEEFITDGITEGMLSFPVKSILVAGASLGMPTELTLMVKIFPPAPDISVVSTSPGPTRSRTGTPETRRNNSVNGATSDGFSFVHPLDATERFAAAASLQKSWRKKAERNVNERAQQKSAATMMQRTVRKKKAKATVAMMKAEKALPEEEKKARRKAAAGIQAGFRAKRAKSKSNFLKEERERPEDEQDQRGAAATKVQAKLRGNAAKTKAARMSRKMQREREAAAAKADSPSSNGKRRKMLGMMSQRSKKTATVTDNLASNRSNGSANGSANDRTSYRSPNRMLKAVGSPPAPAAAGAELLSA